MSAAQHDREAQAHARVAEQHAAQYDPNATTTQERCRARAGGAARAGVDFADYTDICWTSVTNPTETHLRQAAEHRRHADDHRAGSAALREAEARACVGINPDDRDTSPFDHVEDIGSIVPLIERTGTSEVPSQRTAGAAVTFRAVPGMTTERLQRILDCHLARNASLGHVVPEMPTCPLVPNGAEARVTSTGSGFTVAIRSGDNDTAREILARAQRVRGDPVRSPAPEPR
jgi:hypothetical protein